MCSFSIAGFSFRMFHGKIGIIRIRKAVFGSGNVGNVINLCCVFMCVNIVSHDIFYIISFGIPVIFPIDWYPKVNIQGTWSTKWRIFPTFDFDRCVKLGPLCDLRRLVVASKEQMSLLQGKLVEGGAERQQLEWLWRKLLMTIASCDYECLFSSSLRMIIRGVVIIVLIDSHLWFFCQQYWAEWVRPIIDRHPKAQTTMSFSTFMFNMESLTEVDTTIDHVRKSQSLNMGCCLNVDHHVPIVDTLIVDTLIVDTHSRRP